VSDGVGGAAREPEDGCGGVGDGGSAGVRGDRNGETPLAVKNLRCEYKVDPLGST